MNCGHCKSQNVTVDHVRACSQDDRPEPMIGRLGGTPAMDLTPNRPTNGATEKQIKFLTALLADRDHGFDEATQALQLNITTQSRKDTSKLIDHLLSLPKKPTAVTGELPDGIYRKDDVLYRVYRTVHGANQQVASIINLDAPKGSTKKAKFTYVGKAVLRTLTVEDMLPFEEACTIASAYEWCIACGTILHNDKSVELGIGPICRGKFA